MCSSGRQSSLHHAERESRHQGRFEDRPVAVHIYDHVGGTGAKSTYRIITFQPATILSVSFQGNPKNVTIQPTLIEDPTAIPGAATAWTSGDFCACVLPNKNDHAASFISWLQFKQGSPGRCRH